MSRRSLLRVRRARLFPLPETRIEKRLMGDTVTKSIRERRRVALQFALLIFLGTLLASTCRRVRFWRWMGWPGAARRLYSGACLTLGLGVWGAMAAQEVLLLRAGLLTWRTGLPLHLCSFMGLLTLPMLLTGRPLLRNLSFYLGLPGAGLALLFPSIIRTPWPGLTALMFYLLHVLLVLAPFLPISQGWRPRPVGALAALGVLMLLGLCVMGVNQITGGNYLFLAGPVSGTPLTALARWGLDVYRALLLLLCAAALGVEALLVHMARRYGERLRGIR